MSVQPLKRMTYLSTAVAMFSSEELRALIEESVVNNAKKGITGVLYYRCGQFLQVIEGPSEAIDTLWNKLVKDPRHAWVEALHVEEGVERLFGSWSMGLCDMDGTEPPPRAEFTAIAKFLRGCPDLNELAIVRGLLNYFEQSGYATEVHEAA